MKKRILALALAGTTAFSVFGAAMSANAAEVWYSGSSHSNAYDGSYYSHYQPAGAITLDNTYSDSKSGNSGVALYSPQANLVGSAVPQNTLLYVKKADKANFLGKGYTNLQNLEDMDGYYATMEDFMTSREVNYSKATMSMDTTHNVITISAGGTSFVLTTVDGRTGADVQYRLFDTDTWFGDSGLNRPTGYTAVTETAFANQNLYYYTASDYATAYIMTNAANSDMSNELVNFIKSQTPTYYYIADAVDTYNLKSGMSSNLYYYGPDLQVVTKQSNNVNGVGTASGATILDATDVTDLDAILENPVVSSGVVYLYDYYYDETFPELTQREFAQGWGDNTLVDTVVTNKNDSYTIFPETGNGYKSIRGDIMLAWEDFLDELGILDYRNNTTHLSAWAEDTIDNYAYTYQDSSIITDVKYNSNGTFTITFGGSVNLYNFDLLIEDILYAATGDNAEDLQSSQLVYLMQQYDKYVSEGFVDVNPVESDDWGDLLVALASAPTEDEFRTSAAYKRYTGSANDLIEKYEEAATSVAVNMAEEDLYDFVTGQLGWTGMAASEKVDTATLATSIDNTYFNANWARIGDSYAGGTDADGNLSTANWNKNIQVNTDYGTAWALYPAGDYSGSSQGVYAGVDATSIKNVSSEYKWFYSVFALAYDVYTGNDYQSVVDLMATTLDEAVDALIPSQNAYPSEVLAAEEQNDKLESLIETDYTTSMWSNRNKINSYINDRITNDEIGHNGSRNAADIAELTAKLLGWQKNQTVVTRSDINTLKDTLESAETALSALRNDEENYNAAQANALQKAIDECNVIIDLYNGKYGTNKYVQSINGEFNGATGDKDQILKSDITDATQAVEDAINFKNVIMGWYDSTGDGDWMYGVADTYDSDLTWGTEDTLSGPHYLNFGWAKIGNTWFYFDEEGIALKSDWLQVGNDWYYFNSNCGAAVGWARVNNQWYYFNGGCRMMTGWQRVEGNWYYLNPENGAMVTGWCQVGGKWYYLSQASNSLGQMLYSTTTPDGYQVGADGALVE